jgi:hypothetical protein
MANSALEINYDSCTRLHTTLDESTPIFTPVPTPSRNLTSPPHQRRAGSPTASPASVQTCADRDAAVQARHAALQMGTVAVTAIAIAQDSDKVWGRGNALMPSSPLLLSFPSGKGPTKGRNDLVEKLVLEGGPERTISFWRERVAKKAGEASRGGGGSSANAAGGDDGSAGSAGGERRSDLDSHVGVGG